MALYTNMQRDRHGTYYFRQRIPADVQAAFGNKIQLRRSLQTKDPAEAKRRNRKMADDVEAEFAEARRRGQTLGHPADIPQQEADRLAALWLAEVLEQDRKRVQGPISDMGWADTTLLTHTEATFRDILKTGRIESLHETVADFAARHRLTFTIDTPGHRRLALAIARKGIEGAKVLAERRQGEWRSVPTPEVARGLTIMAALAKYQAEKPNQAPKTVAEWGRYVRRFTELHGDLPVASITKAEARSFKEALMAMPARLSEADRRLSLPIILERFGTDQTRPRVGPATINKTLSALSAVMAWAQDQGHAPDGPNPFGRLKLDEPENAEDGRDPYETADLNAIFQGPVHAHGERPKAGAGDAAYWIPLLGLFTGARLEEIGKAEVADIQMEEGHHVLNIARRVKTKSSRRKVPVHPELIRLGFIAYVDAVRAAGQTKLFPDLKPDQNQVLTGMWSKWWGRYARKTLGITDPKKTFHSFRHAFKDACRRARIPQEVHDALTGHKGKGVGDAYGKGMRTLVEVLAGEIEKVTYPGLDLEHLKARS